MAAAEGTLGYHAYPHAASTPLRSTTSAHILTIADDEDDEEDKEDEEEDVNAADRRARGKSASRERPRRSASAAGTTLAAATCRSYAVFSNSAAGPAAAPSDKA